MTFHFDTISTILRNKLFNQMNAVENVEMAVLGTHNLQGRPFHFRQLDFYTKASV